MCWCSIEYLYRKVVAYAQSEWSNWILLSKPWQFTLLNLATKSVMSHNIEWNKQTVSLVVSFPLCQGVIARKNIAASRKYKATACLEPSIMLWLFRVYNQFAYFWKNITENCSNFMKRFSLLISKYKCYIFNNNLTLLNSFDSWPKIGLKISMKVHNSNINFI